MFDRLGNAQINVVSLPRGSDALIEFGRCEPDAVLLAAGLDDMDALAWAEAVRAVSDVPILIGVRSDQLDSLDGLLSIAGTSMVNLPYTASEVLDRLGGWLGGRVQTQSRRPPPASRPDRAGFASILGAAAR